MRYVNIDFTRKCTIEESFMDFINTHEKTGDELSKGIEEKLIADKKDTTNIRGQSYDNYANMAARVHGAQINPKMQTFSDTVQQIYNFSVGSPFRWGLLKSKLKASLKGINDTSWSSSNANAVHALNSQLEKVVNILEEGNNGLTNMSIISIEKSTAINLNYDEIINIFAESKYKKVLF
ncbi:unnamed protein product [Psylliodes chrysocephalus]|uniref:Uncharacterized protein n=1 Tax=Psylliodes chrysocephalus TaxID=3402493 RepID=A0A9P0GE80_9CUCU|nr:unnamed protein product [Psylliodes chrysocephala]